MPDKNSYEVLLKDIASLVIIGASTLYLFGYMYSSGTMVGYGISTIYVDRSIYDALALGFTVLFTTYLSHPVATFLSYSIIVLVYLVRRNSILLCLSIIIFLVGQSLLYFYSGSEGGKKTIARISKSFNDGSNKAEVLNISEVLYSSSANSLEKINGFVLGDNSNNIIVASQLGIIVINKQNVISIKYENLKIQEP